LFNGESDLNSSVVDTLTNIENVNVSGSNGINYIVGSDAANTITGGSGVDTIAGGKGADTITGGAGVDALDGGADADVFLIGAASEHGAGETIVGGAGADVIRFTSTTANDALTLRVGVTDADNAITVEISDAAGLNTGTTALDVDASALVDTLAVTLIGNDGANVLVGNAIADTITGGGGADTMTGGAGADTFIIANADAGITVAAADTISDFATGVDTIDLAGAAGTAANYTEADGSGMANLAAVVTAADAVFDGTKVYYLAYDVNGAGDAYLLYDADGDGSFNNNDVLIVLTGINLANEFAPDDLVD